jgi:NhaA family Na+:H+ antiporter
VGHFFIVPVFALANADIAFEAELKDSISHPVCMGVLFGLALGKPLGIVTTNWLVVRTGISRLPDQVTMRHVLGVGCLARIGFTTALFIANLAFDDAALLGKVKKGQDRHTDGFCGVVVGGLADFNTLQTIPATWCPVTCIVVHMSI